MKPDFACVSHSSTVAGEKPLILKIIYVIHHLHRLVAEEGGEVRWEIYVVVIISLPQDNKHCMVVKNHRSK